MPIKKRRAESLKKILNKSFWILMAVLMFVFFGLSFVVGKKTLNYTGPFFLTAFRMVVASFILLMLQWIVDHKRVIWPKGAWKEILLLSVFNIYFTNILEFWGLQYLSCYKTCYIYSLTPFLSALFSYFFLKERLSRLKVLGLLIAFLGMLPIMIHKELSSASLKHIDLAKLALLGATFATVIGWIMMRRLTTKMNFPILMANSYSMFIGGLLSLFTSWVFEGINPIPVINWSHFLTGALVITLINNIIGYNLYGYLTKKFTITLISFIGFITPLVTALFGWIFLSEPVTILFFISYAVVLVGFYLFSKEELIYNA